MYKLQEKIKRHQITYDRFIKEAKKRENNRFVWRA